MNILLGLAKRPRTLGLSLLVLALIFGWQIVGNARLETDLDAYMPSDHPAFVASDAAEELFGISDAVLIVIEHPQTLYNPGTMEKIQEITLELGERFPQINADQITSLYTAENITGSEWGMEVEAFFDQVPQDAAGLEELEQKVLNNSMINGKIVSNDGRSSIIIAEISDETFTQEFYSQLKDFAAEFEGPETLRIAGRPIIEGELAILGPQDMSRMAPLVLVFMAVILFLLLRSVRDTLINLAIVLFGTLFTFGLKAILGIPMYSVDMMMPVMLIAIGVAYGIHMHNAVHHISLKEPGIGRDELARKTLKAMTRPVIMTGITTAIGFASLMTSQVLPVRYFGLFIALGVMVEMFLALVLFPGSLYLFGPVKKGKETENELHEAEKPAKIVESRGSRVIRRPGLILGLTALIVVLAGWGTTMVWIDTSFLANFQKDSDIALTDKFVNDNFGGTSTIQVIFSADQPEMFKNPESLALITQLQAEVDKNPLVGNSFGLTDYLSRMHRVMNEDRADFEVIPEDQDLIAQYLLLYEMSGDPDNLAKVVDFPYQNLNLTFQLKSDSSALITEVIQTVQEYQAALEDQGISVSYAGSGYKAYVFAQLLLEGQIWSLGLSFVLVLVLLALMFKSLLLGLVGTVPIAITAVVNFGVMGLLGIPLSSATALISSIAVGIGVDYAIHLIEHYLVRREEGDSTELATAETLTNTGRAIIFNAVTIIGGFGVLLFSVFPPNKQVGGLVGLNMAVSAIGTLTVLMVLVRTLDRKGRLPFSRRSAT